MTRKLIFLALLATMGVGLTGCCWGPWDGRGHGDGGYHDRGYHDRGYGDHGSRY